MSARVDPDLAVTLTYEATVDGSGCLKAWPLKRRADQSAALASLGKVREPWNQLIWVEFS